VTVALKLLGRDI